MITTERAAAKTLLVLQNQILTTIQVARPGKESEARPLSSGNQNRTPDGRAISFINSVNGVGNIWEQPVTGGPPKPVTHFTSDEILSFDWSRDGRLALSRGTEPTDAVLIKNFQ